MSNKIVVPEGMWIAGFNATITIADRGEATTKCLEAALRWLSENPIVPTSRQERELVDSWIKETSLGKTEHLVTEWQRRMFLAPEPEVPEEIKDLLAGVHPDVTPIAIEAYRRGQKSK